MTWRMNNDKLKRKPREWCHRSHGKQKVSGGNNIKCCREAKLRQTEKCPTIWTITLFITLVGVISVDWRVNSDCRELRSG